MIRVKELSIEVERNGSVVKIEYCTGPEFSSQDPQSGVPGHLHSHMHINNPPHTYI